MDREKLHLLNTTGATNFQGLEKPAPNPSNDWKSSRGLAWLAAFVAAFCASAFVVVARCLLRQGGEVFPVELAAGSFVGGALAAIALLRVPRIWNLSSASWLAVAGLFVSAWGFKLLEAEGLRFALVPFAVFGGALVGSLAISVRSSVLAALVGATAAQPVIKLLIPEAGYTASFYALVAALAVVFLIVAALMRVRVLLLLAGVAVLGVAAVTAPVNLSRVTSLDGWTFVRRKEGVDAAVTLIEQRVKPGQPMLQRLILDNRHIIAGQLGFGEKRLGHLPLLLNPSAKSVLFLNANAGVSVAAAKSYPGLERIDCVEPLAEVAAFLPQFVISNDQITDEPRAKFIQRDIRKFIGDPGAAYDVIVANPTPPALLRSQRLLTAEFYAVVKKRLAPGGVFMQWLPLFQLDERSLRTVVATFAGSFANAQGFIGIYNGELPVFGLVARNGGEMPSLESIQKIIQPNPGVRAFVADTRDLFGSQLLDHAALAAFGRADGLLTASTGPAQDARLGGELLRLLITGSQAPAVDLAMPGEGDAAAVMKRAVASRREAVRHYLLGDILRAADTRTPGNEELQRGMVTEYLLALDSEPDLPMTRQMLSLQSLLRPNQAARIYQGILKHRPDDKVVKDMLCTAQERDAQNVGVPLPPSPCAPGALTAPAPAPRKPGVTRGLQAPNTNFFTPATKSPMPAPPAFPKAGT